MKTFYFTLLMFATTAVLTATPATEEKKIALPRLTQVDAFPDQYRDAVRAVIAALSADGITPSEYFAQVSLTKEGMLEFYLKHQSHPADDSGWRGDACGRCRTTSYDLKTGKVSKIYGIR
jgi:hypothetical protein